MKYLSFAIVLLLLNSFQNIKAQQRGFQPVNLDINGQSVSLYNQSHALVIGISQYTNGWPDLPGVKSDATAIKQALENKGFNVVLIENTTDQQLDDAIADFISRYGNETENRLLIYFAGHGHTIKTTYGEELGYIVPANAPNLC